MKGYEIEILKSKTIKIIPLMSYSKLFKILHFSKSNF